MLKLFLKISAGFLLMFICFSVFANAVFAREKSDCAVNVYFFWAKGCPHCKHEKPFLEKLERENGNVNIHRFEITESESNLKLLQRAGRKLQADTSGVPFTVVGDKYFIGFYDEETTGKSIKKAVKCALKNGCPDIIGGLEKSESSYSKDHKEKSMPAKIKLPVFGEMETKDFSLPVLTVIIAGLDGFNPCAMWVLLFLISLLLGMKDRKRMWILGGTFIVSSAAVYFLFMSAWLNLFLFLGFVLWVRIIIAAVALFSGGYNLKEYFTNRGGACKVTSGEKRKKVFDKLREITHKRQFWLALAGIIFLAFAVNLVELICSAGLPAVFTQVLTLSHLPVWQYYLYLLFYIFIFMLDDLIVFFIAMATLRIVGVTGKYSRYSHLIGGIIMIIVGVLLLCKPEWLMFG